MNKFLAISIVTASLAVTGCSENKIETKLKEAVKAKMRDPSSAQFRNTTIDPNYTYTVRTKEHLLWDLGGKKGPEPEIKEITYKTELVCIEANGKNAFGAYAGFQKFCCYQDGDGSYSGYDVEKKEESEAASRRFNSIADEIQQLNAISKKRGYATPAEAMQANDLLYKLKQASRESFEKSVDYTLPLADDPK